MFLKLLLWSWFMAGHPSDTNFSLLEWKASRKLTWEDFKGQPDGSSVNAALTSTSINIDYSYNNSGLNYDIRCQFDPSKSWGRIKTEYILAHEQAHFDIAEIYARILKKEMKNYQFKSKTATQDISAIYDGVMKRHHAMQELYDDETNYSRNEKQQQEWAMRIVLLLKELEDFAR